VLEVLRSMYAMTYDGEGTVVDKRRAKMCAAKRRPPQGSRLVHVDTCRTARCLDVDHLKAELLIDPPPEPEHGRVWTRAIITAVRPPANPAQSWSATYESTKTRGSFPLDDRALKALGIAEGGSLALEHEVLLMSQHDKAGPVELYPVPLDDEWLPNGFPGTAELAPTGWLKPSDPCVCLSGLSFVTCHGVPRPTSALLYA
jgi:hypothetical protein